MRFWLCIDDTDDTTKSVGTGEIASEIYRELEKQGCVMRYQITRHQLLLDPRIPYTSHNSSMCMEGEGELTAEEIWERAIFVLMRMRSPISQPGVCLYTPPAGGDPRRLIRFGEKAKEEILTIEEAQRLASETPGIRLEAPAGNGSGQIGALAGVGLRLGGNDGTFRGKLKFPEALIRPAKEMKQLLGVREIIKSSGQYLEEETPVRASGQVKLIYREHECMAAVRKADDGIYELCSKASIFEATITKRAVSVENCEHFQWDNDRGEQWSEQKGACENCLHRKLVRKGMKCTYYNRLLVTTEEELKQGACLPE